MTKITTAATVTYPESNANFQAWVSLVGTNLLALGLARSSDVGRINPSTVSAPSTVNTSAGWEIFIFQDALQATAPVFIKIEYGVGLSTGVPAIWVTVGTGSDGAGNLTGQVGSRIIVSGTNSTNAYASIFCGSTNRFYFVLWCGTSFNNSSNATISVSIERTHNSSGGDTSAGIIVFCGAGGVAGDQYNQYIPFSGTVPAARTDTATVVPAGTSGASGNTVNIYPIRIWASLTESSPSLNYFLYYGADIAVTNSVSVNTWDGSTHQMIASGYTSGSTSGLIPTISGAAISVGLRWD